MHVARGKDAEPQRATGEMFTGEVYRRALAERPEGTSLGLALVKFRAGARTKWHRHTFDQGLIIVEGKGIVATEGEEHVVEAGDAVVIPAGEKHWHGGSDTTEMAHVAINQPGESIVLEPVEQIKTKNV